MDLPWSSAIGLSETLPHNGPRISVSGHGLPEHMGLCQQTLLMMLKKGLLKFFRNPQDAEKLLGHPQDRDCYFFGEGYTEESLQQTFPVPTIGQ